MYCKKCGAKLGEDGLFCPRCGERFTAAAPGVEYVDGEGAEKADEDADGEK